MIGDMCTKFEVDPSHKKEVSEWTPFRLQTDGQMDKVKPGRAWLCAFSLLVF